LRIKHKATLIKYLPRNILALQ